MGLHRVGHGWSDFACTHALEKDTAAHSSILAWRVPGTEEPGGLPSVRSHRVGHGWSNLAAAGSKCLKINQDILNSTWIKMKSWWKVENIFIWKITKRLHPSLLSATEAVLGEYSIYRHTSVFIVLCFIALHGYCVSLRSEEFISATCPVAFSHW